ncbi:type IV pilus modification PilV family protein [Thalassotalea euphylliae]|uniref:Prepilin-type N-terminal cleavage/methylation domain-containing protein n=1 Tax=Thalassotalea euphylliae TaxID=1655234 RepID=A0A3E0UE95_9GAMM|nr:prepilin-type N-terminal cleavage/methylation domain-containing protein [Thalassotalea euphylliae]REL34887.1 hypothetical protein DXX92_05650 [Thalassotalea euphylliae]
MNRSKGFTLLEVLVAGVILFSVVATVALIYKNAMHSLQLSEKHLAISTAVPFLLDEIKDEIRNQSQGSDSLAGEGSNIKAKFYWEASVVKSGRPNRSALNENGDNVKQKFKLWQVSLTMSYNTYVKKYQFQELSWESD